MCIRNERFSRGVLGLARARLSCLSEAINAAGVPLEMARRMSATFRSLVGESSSADTSALGAWYARVAEVPVEQLQIGDLCRAVRQELALPYIVPIAVELVSSEPSAGELYDGELAVALARIPRDFWAANRLALDLVRRVLAETVSHVDDEVRVELAAFVEMADAIL